MSEQIDMFPGDKHYTFAGADYVASRDHARLTGQIKEVHKIMLDGKWHTVAAIANAIGAQATSVSAQIRNLRKPENGGYEIERRYHKEHGHSEYKMTVL